MRKVPVKKLLTSVIVLLMFVLSLVPVIAEAAAGDEDELTNAPTAFEATIGDEDELVDPTAAFDAKAGDEDELIGTGFGDEDELIDPTAVQFQEGQSGRLTETGIVLGIIALILLLSIVAAVIGAVNLGIIGLGNRQSESSRP